MQLLPSTRLMTEGAVEYQLPGDFFSNVSKNPFTRFFIYAPKSPAAVALVRQAYAHEIPYIPVDLQVPFERAFSLFVETGPSHVFINRHTPLYAYLASHYHIKILWEETSQVLLNVEQEQKTEHAPGLAAVLFTSGSTGIPKGVMISRENMLVFVEWMVNEYRIGPQSKILSVSPLNFDLSVFEMFAAFTTGSGLYFPPSGELVNPMLLAEYIYRQKVDVIYATPSWFRLLVHYGKTNRYNFDFVTTVLLAGEALDEKLVNQLQILFPSAHLANLYGPTETNVCLYYDLPTENIPARYGMVPVGNACPYAKVILNSENVLEVSGETVMMGYWPEPGYQKTYPTGDVMEYDPAEKVYYFIGRKDGMVKRHGYRIELGEIEACLGKLNAVQQVAVTTMGNGENLKIVAHLVAATPLHPDQLRAHCLQYLPVYMIPDLFRQHQNFPLTGSGKTDYRKLAEYGAK